jgi:hypothetical protein
MTKVYDIKVSQTVPGEMGRVLGSFKFDGRTKAGQAAVFTHIPGADPETDIFVSFKVISERKGQKIRKVMKECSQKDEIIRQLAVFLKDVDTDEPEQEFGVDTERELADKAERVGFKLAKAELDSKMEAAHARSNKLIGAAMIKDPELRRWANNAIDKAEGRVPVEAALGKDHEDLLEIPEFLKRS